MEKRSKLLIMFVFLALATAVVYAYYRYVWAGNFLIDESQVEEMLTEDDGLPEEGAAGDDIPEPSMVESQ